MTKEIKRVVNHMLDICTRMVSRELPLVSKGIRAINMWIWDIDYRKAIKLEDAQRAEYDLKKIEELKREVGKIKAD